MDNGYNRRSFVRQVSTLLCTLPQAAFARQVPPARVRRIGFLIGGVQSLIDAFKLVPGRSRPLFPQSLRNVSVPAKLLLGSHHHMVRLKSKLCL